MGRVYSQIGEVYFELCSAAVLLLKIKRSTKDGFEKTPNALFLRLYFCLAAAARLHTYIVEQNDQICSVWAIFFQFHQRNEKCHLRKSLPGLASWWIVCDPKYCFSFLIYLGMQGNVALMSSAKLSINSAFVYFSILKSAYQKGTIRG